MHVRVALNGQGTYTLAQHTSGETDGLIGRFHARPAQFEFHLRGVGGAHCTRDRSAGGDFGDHRLVLHRCALFVRVAVGVGSHDVLFDAANGGFFTGFQWVFSGYNGTNFFFNVYTL